MCRCNWRFPMVPDMSICVKISELASPCLTRRRGKDAAKKLKQMVGTQMAEIDIDDVEMLSLSFLDGLISELVTSGLEASVVFRTSNQESIAKLQHIAAIRPVSLSFQSGDQAVRLVTPRPTAGGEPVFAEEKEPE